jgi:hypothetical protein
MDPDHAASARARLQHGLITRAQARQLGISDDAIDWRMKNGVWQRVHRGVLRLPGAPVTWQQKVMAACLAIPRATASHRAASALWEIPEVPTRPEITVLEHHAIRLDGVDLHRAERLDRRDRVWRGRIPVTSLPRTVIDLSSTLRPDQVKAVVEHVLAKRRVSLSDLRDRLEDLGTQGRRGAGGLAEMLLERQGRLPTPHFGSPPLPKTWIAIEVRKKTRAFTRKLPNLSGIRRGGLVADPHHGCPCEERTRSPRGSDRRGPGSSRSPESSPWCTRISRRTWP